MVEINTMYILNQVDMAGNGALVTFYSLFKLQRLQFDQEQGVFCNLFSKGTSVVSLMFAPLYCFCIDTVILVPVKINTMYILNQVDMAVHSWPFIHYSS